MSEKKKLGKAELTWYVIGGIILLAGIVFFIFGCIGNYYPGKLSDNFVNSSEFVIWLRGWSKMDLYWWGLIFIGVAALIFVIALSNFAKEGDRDAERAARRKQRQLSFEDEPVEVTVTEKAVEEANAPKAQ